MNVEPRFPENQRQCVRALHGIGARVTGVGERPFDWLDDNLRRVLAGYEQVGSVTDEQSLYDTVRRVQAREWVGRLEATVEAHILPTAGCGKPARFRASRRALRTSAVTR
jgi:hypothetical protein